MKTRVLSLVLAVVMVLSMAAVFSFASSAEDSFKGVTVTVGTAYAVAGETAQVDVYVSADAIPDDLVRLRNWEFVFNNGADDVKLGAEADTAFFSRGGDAKAYINNTENKVGCSSPTTKDGVEANCGSKAEVLARGGWKIASIGFVVPDGVAAGTEIPVEIATVNVLGFEDADISPVTNVADETVVVAGKIIVVEALDGAVAAKAGEGDDFVYAIPAFEGDTVYSKMTKSGKLTGEFDTVVFPASLTSIAGNAVTGATIDKIVLKNTDFAGVGPLVETAGTAIYYHKRANGSDTTKAAIDTYIEEESENEPEVINILQVYNNGVEDGKVWFVAGIAADDLDYDSLYLEAKFVQGETTKTLTKKVNNVYNTIKGKATNGKGTAAASGVELVDAAYLTALTINGVPAGDYVATFTLYGVTADFNGCPIWVCSDSVVVDVTV